MTEDHSPQEAPGVEVPKLWRLSVSANRVLLGTAVGVLLLYPGFLGFKGIQQWRLRQCLPLIESTDPEVRKKGVWKALSFHVIYPDRKVTRSMVAALPYINDRERAGIIVRMGYWEGRSFGPEDVPVLVKILESKGSESPPKVVYLLSSMGRDAQEALPALRAKLGATADKNGSKAEAVKTAIDSIEQDMAGQ
jgi:hypothetical protein